MKNLLFETSFGYFFALLCLLYAISRFLIIFISKNNRRKAFSWCLTYIML